MNSHLAECMFAAAIAKGTALKQLAAAHNKTCEHLKELGADTHSLCEQISTIESANKTLELQAVQIFDALELQAEQNGLTDSEQFICKLIREFLETPAQ